VLPCPIDYAAIRAASEADARIRIGVPADACLLLFLGNDFYRKGLDLAIRALPWLEEDVHLLVVGSGHARPFRSLAERVEVSKRVHFLGHENQPERFLRDADLLLLPTREDVWGIALVEAMAAGLPIVTTSVAGASPVVRNARAGIVVDSLSPQGLAEAVSSLLADSTAREEIHRTAPRAAEAYDVSRLAPRLLAILEQAAVVPARVAA
jgi:glycosyltransferase involved in cell wall biosynthesis